MGKNIAYRPKPTYRPEIDGLRAVAVLSVVLYHADFPVAGKNLVPGGFLGVDIFFVISGYLISSILIKEMDEKGFSFIGFYERRARRILPVLLTVMLAFIPVAWIFLIPGTMRDYCYSLISSLLFTSNFYFWSEDPYWVTDGTIRPFLHSWSLAVEEQFYIGMPLLIAALLHINRRRRLPMEFVVICVLALASLILAQWASTAKPEFGFYLLPARMWELLAGTGLAFLERRKTRTNSAMVTRFRAIRNLPTLGICLVVIPMFGFSSHTPHPSAFTLVPVTGTMMIIWFANKNHFSIKLLSTRPFVAIGLISYGLYLWHYPLFAFRSIIWKEHGNSVNALLIALSVFLATVTFFLIERPARNRGQISIRMFLTTTGLAAFLVLSFSLIGLLSGYAFRFPPFLAEQPKAERFEQHQWIGDSNGTAVNRGIIVAGDSHMQMLAPELHELAIKAGFDFAISTYNGCQLIEGTNRVNVADLSAHKRCTSALQESRLSFIENARPSFVILGGRLPLILEETRFDNQEGGFEGPMSFFIQDDANSLKSRKARQAFIQRQYQRTINHIRKAGHRVVLIYPIPEVGWNVPEKLAAKIIANSGDARTIVTMDPVTTSAAVFAARTKTAYQLLDAINGPDIIRVYPEQLFCNTSIPGRCVTHDTENLFYRDDDHLSDIGARMLAELVMAALRNED